MCLLLQKKTHYIMVFDYQRRKDTYETSKNHFYRHNYYFPFLNYIYVRCYEHGFRQFKLIAVSR